MDILEAICAIPKVELHVHIVGSIRPETLLSIIETDGIKAPYTSTEQIAKRFEYTDFLNFIIAYMEIVDYIVDERHFEQITYEMLENCAENNVHYVEASFSPRDHLPRGLTFDKMSESINSGIQRAKKDFGIETNLRVDIVRNSSFDEGMEIVDLIEKKPDNIITIDLGGKESGWPPRRFAEHYKRATAMGLHRVAHAGEAAGPESIWDAIQSLDVERIGHGVTARQDPELVEHLKREQIAIEMCPVSNLRTGVVKSMTDHPIREFFDKGLLVTVSSDDPSLFHTSMNNEYIQLHEHLDFSLSELFQISLNGIQTAFIDDGMKAKLQEKFEGEFRDIETQLVR
ncbi:MAG: adenosine deaminase [Candidatus Thorarchaeota archaeon]